jgi:hypothetical protein
MGVVLYIMVCGWNPFLEPNDSETITRILDANYRPLPPTLSADCVQ